MNPVATPPSFTSGPSSIPFPFDKPNTASRIHGHLHFPATGPSIPRLGRHALDNQTPGLPPPTQMSMPSTMPMWPLTYSVSPSHFFCIALMYCALSTHKNNIMCIGIRLRPCKRIFSTNLFHRLNTYLITPLCLESFGKSTAFDTDATTYSHHPCSCPSSASTPLTSVGFPLKWHHPYQHSLQQFSFVLRKAVTVSLKTPDGCVRFGEL